MSDLHVTRTHNFGIEKAREVTDYWLESAETEYKMTCELVRTETQDTVTFKRSGVNGKFVSTTDDFEITAKLGFLFRSFLPRIEEQLNKNLDELLKKS